MVAALDVRGRQLVSRVAGKRLLELADGVNELASAVIPHTLVEIAHHIHQAGETVLSVVIEHLIDTDRFSFALYHHLVDVADAVGAAQAAECIFADEDLRRVGFARAFKPRGEVHAVADQRVVHALCRADVAGDHHVGVEADAHLDRLLTALAPIAAPPPTFADHGDRRTNRAVLVVVMRYRKPERRHYRVADEFVEHAFLAGDALDHQGEILVEEGDRALGAHFLAQGGEAPDIREEDGRPGAGAAEEASVAVIVEHARGNRWVHVARHGGLDALLGADVLDHQQRAELLAIATLQGQHRKIDRGRSVVKRDLDIDGNIGEFFCLNLLYALNDPLVLAAEKLGCAMPEDGRRCEPHDAGASAVAGDDGVMLVQRDDPVRHAFQHALVVVLDLLDVIKQLGVFKGDGDLRCEGFEA